MSEIEERYQRVAGEFSSRVRAVPSDAWDNPSPCEGWTARDVVGHLTGWIPGFFGAHGLEFPPVPSVQDDPVAAWETVRATLTEALADPAVAARTVETPFSSQSLAETVDMIVTGDVFTHTWDLARHRAGRDARPRTTPTDGRCHRSDARGSHAGRRHVRTADRSPFRRRRPDQVPGLCRSASVTAIWPSICSDQPVPMGPAAAPALSATRVEVQAETAADRPGQPAPAESGPWPLA